MTIRVFQNNVAGQERDGEGYYISMCPIPVFRPGKQDTQANLDDHSQDQRDIDSTSSSSSSGGEQEYDDMAQQNNNGGYHYYGHYQQHPFNGPSAGSQGHQPWTYHHQFQIYRQNQHQYQYQYQNQGQGQSYAPRNTAAQEVTPHWAINRNPILIPSQNQNGNGIIYEGEGVVLAGQSSDHFQDEWSLELCYQCCKRVPLDMIYETRTQHCGADSCERVERAGLGFMAMPNDALDTCDEFRALVVWWMDKIDCGAVEDISNRAKERVQEVRDDIPLHGRGD